MITLETLTEADVRAAMSKSTFRRATMLLNRITAQARHGNRLVGQVRGTSLYNVDVLIEADTIHATCTCAYSYGGLCKHLGALLLKWIDAPASFDTSQRKDTALDPLPPPPPTNQRPPTMPGWVGSSFAAWQTRRTSETRALLEQLRLQDIRDIARRYGWSLRGNRKSDIVVQFAEHLADPDNMGGLLATLTPAQRAQLNAQVIVGNSDTLDKERMRALAHQWHPQPADALELSELGLTFNVSPPFIGRPALPEPLAAALQPHLALIAPTAPPSTVTAGDRALLLQHLTQVLALLAQQPKSLTGLPRLMLERYHRVLTGWRYDAQAVAALQRAGKLSAGATRCLAVPPPPHALDDAALSAHVGSAARLDFYYWLLHAAGLVLPGTLVQVWQEVQLQFVQRAPAEQYATLVWCYFELTEWGELHELLRRSPDVRLERLWADYLELPMLDHDLHTARMRIVRLLATLPDDAWLALADIEALLQPIFATFDAHEVATTRFGRYRSGEPAWRLARAGATVTWENGQRPFLQQVVTTLHWLGLADLGHTDDRLTHVRLRGLADLFWLRAKPPVALPATAEAAVRFEDALILVVPNTISGAAHAFLDTIGRLVRTEPTQFGWQLDAAAVHARFEDGLSHADLLALWRQHFDAEPPPAVRAQLAAWWAHYGDVRLYEDVALIEFGDDHALIEMRAVTSLNAHIVAQLSARAVLVRQAAVDILATELQQAGYTPKVGA